MSKKGVSDCLLIDIANKVAAFVDSSVADRVHQLPEPHGQSSADRGVSGTVQGGEIDLGEYVQVSQDDVYGDEVDEYVEVEKDDDEDQLEEYVQV